MPASFPPAWVVELQSSFDPARGVWLVGGAVRDHLLGRPSHDLDFAVDGEARQLARRVANRLGADYFDLDSARDSGRVLHRGQDGVGWVLDFSRLRSDRLEDDLAGRDFTLNAMAIDLRRPEHWIDPTGGAADLRARRLRACSSRSITDDPVRALRAIRLALDLSLQIEPSTTGLLRGAAGALRRISAERMRDEVMRVLDLPRPAAAMRLLDQLDLLGEIFPELVELKGLEQPPQHAYDAWVHTLAVCDHLADLLAVLDPRPDEELSANLTLGLASVRLGRFRESLHDVLGHPLTAGRSLRSLWMLAALLHDVGKSRTGTRDPKGTLHFVGHERLSADLAARWGEQMRLSGVEVERLKTVVANHMRPGQLEKSRPITPRAIYRYYRQLGEAGVDVVLLSLADFLGKHHPPPPQQAWAGRLGTSRTLLEAYFERASQVVDPPRLIDGEVLMRHLGLTPGRTVGDLLEAVREAQVEGEVATPEQALEYARSAHHSGDSGTAAEG